MTATPNVPLAPSRAGKLFRVAAALLCLTLAALCARAAWRARPAAASETPAAGAPAPDGPATAFDGYDPALLPVGLASTPRAFAALVDRESSGRFSAIAISPDGKWIAAASEEAVVLWRAGEVASAVRLTGLPRVVRALAFRPDSRALLLGGTHGSEQKAEGWVQLWRFDKVGIVAGPSLSQTTGVRCLAFVPGQPDLAVIGGAAVAASPMREVKDHPRLQLLRIRSTDFVRVAELSGTGAPIKSLAVSPDGRFLAVLIDLSAQIDKGQLQLYRLGPAEVPAWSRWAVAGILATAAMCFYWPWLRRRRVEVQFLVLGLLICLLVPSAGAWAGAAHGGTHKELESFSVASHAAVAFSPDGRLVVSDSVHVRGWQRHQDKLTETTPIRAHDENVTALAVPAGGPWLTSLDHKGGLRVTHLVSRQPMREDLHCPGPESMAPTHHNEKPMFDGRAAPLGGRWPALAVSPDGRYAVVAVPPAGLVVLQLWARGDSEKEVQEATAAVAKAPADPTALEARARIYLRQGCLSQAVTDLTAVLAKRPSKEAHWLRAMAHARREDRAAAMRDLDEVIRIDPKDALAHYHLGLMQMQTKAYGAAKKSFTTAFRLDPGLAKAAGVEDKEKRP